MLAGRPRCLEQAVAAYRATLEERTRERVPLNWAISHGSEGVALMQIAERRGDLSAARAALNRIEAAMNTSREGGHKPFADRYAWWLNQGEAIIRRLGGAA
jgi:hypothetical protein